MTKNFSKWISKQKISDEDLKIALSELESGQFEANLGGYLYKKRVRFEGKGKSGSGRTIICYKKDDRAIFIHGFAKNEKSNLSPKELHAMKEFSRIIIKLSQSEIEIAIQNGDFIEVRE
ncbi:type II toxin-antitoxin system RelE/ParE family toxin [Desulfamplus magnetovallimortis]|nr:type II toxin-antitoxin system RelE/ParE family toxin [Desulfamplus magnetovallimortis]